ncbi:acetylxylan esterase [Lewinella sp. W8]|uniref:glucuronyl esterase domain-containing protein n=1 Tax=Lewinella sp. W8 TaxID=2528208 RepID=UPI0010687203|nr:acetylxylan esterase [Lewinella sp. W8]MTB50440.1 acetylxylan esterase [Lewinella sp. W8]
MQTFTPTLANWKFEEGMDAPPSVPDLSTAEWTDLRPQILDHFEREVYGEFPDKELLKTEDKVLEGPTRVFGGKGYRAQIVLTLEGRNGDQRKLLLLLYYPASVGTQKVPVLLNLNFLGNAATSEAPEIILSDHEVYTSRAEERGFINLRPTEKSRGIRRGRLPVEYLLAEGYAVVTAGYQDILPDDDAAARPIMESFYGLPPAETGAIAIWARGYHWLADYAERQSFFRVGHLVATGHSRLGKAVLWAAATDDRIRAVHVNNSGCGGAALFRRAQGETIGDITSRFPHWFRDKFHGWAHRDHLIPYDQDWLLASLAPRKVLIASATEDAWADPEGEFLGLREALPAYRSFAPGSNLPESMPAPQDGYAYGSGLVGYHMRRGPHDLQESDYRAFLALLKR